MFLVKLGNPTVKTELVVKSTLMYKNASVACFEMEQVVDDQSVQRSTIRNWIENNSIILFFLCVG